jgi:hypothetical protein
MRKMMKNGQNVRIYNTKVDVRETGLQGMDWIHLAQDRNWWQALVNMVMNLWVP